MKRAHEPLLYEAVAMLTDQQRAEFDALDEAHDGR